MLNIQKHNIVTNWLSKKGWKLFSHQKEVINFVTKFHNILLISPTGSGKTLAGFLPAVIDLNTRKDYRHKLHTLYISPLRSLTNDVERKISNTLNEIDLGISVASRTGDTNTKKKHSQIKYPPNILMTTLESFSILMSEKNSNIFFKNLRYVIIDEVHSILNTKRGELLSLNLSRLNTFSNQQKRILLSATIKSEVEAAKYFSYGRIKVIKSKIEKDIEIKILKHSMEIPWSGHTATFVTKNIYKLLISKTSIVYVNTRAQAELLFQNLWNNNSKNLKIALHHGSLEKKLRINVENQMSKGEIDCIIATSSLELGIDWSNVDLILQIGAPKGITRLIQRVGRSNHYLGGKSNAVLVPTNKFEYLECYGAIQAIKENDLENLVTRKGSLDVLTQFIMGVACSHEINVSRLLEIVKNSWPFRHVKKKTFLEIIDFLSTGGYSLENYEQFKKLQKNKHGNYILTSEKFIKKYKMNVGTIVESQMLEVKLNNKKLGKIEDFFIQKLQKGDTFIFGGQIVKLNSLNQNIVKVSKSDSSRPKIPSYAGGKMPISTKLSNRVLDVINNTNAWKLLPKQVSEYLEFQKLKSTLPPKNGLLIEFFPRKRNSIIEYCYVFYSFQGSNVNQTLGFILSKKLESKGLKPLGFVFSDYALALCVDRPIPNIKVLFNYKEFNKSVYNWLEDSSLFKRNFKMVAVISGLLDRGYPNQKNNNQLSINSDLIFNVLKKYEKNHILMRATHEESRRDLIELDRLEDYLNRMSKKIIVKNLKKPSPLSIPLIVEINSQVLNKKSLDEFYLQKIEQDLINEIGIR